jgi:hypothetical protein
MDSRRNVRKKITHKDLVGDVKKIRGFMGFNTGRFGSTAPWGRLQTVGHAMFSEKSPLACKKTLLIRQGGIKDEALPRFYKTMFREDVLPAIKTFVPNCGDIFRLTLHFNFNLLMHVELEHIT